MKNAEFYYLESTVMAKHSNFLEYDCITKYGEDEYICAAVYKEQRRNGYAEVVALVKLDKNFNPIMFKCYDTNSPVNVISKLVVDDDQHIFALIEGNGFSDPHIIRVNPNLELTHIINLDEQFMEAAREVMGENYESFTQLSKDMILGYVNAADMMVDGKHLILVGGIQTEESISKMFPFIMFIDMDGTARPMFIERFVNDYGMRSFQQLIKTDEHTFFCFCNNNEQIFHQLYQQQAGSDVQDVIIIPDKTIGVTFRYEHNKLNTTISDVNFCNDVVVHNEPTEQNSAFLTITNDTHQFTMDSVIYDQKSSMYFGIGMLRTGDENIQALVKFDTYHSISDVYLLAGVSTISAASIYLTADKISIFVDDCNDEKLLFCTINTAFEDAKVSRFPAILDIESMAFSHIIDDGVDRFVMTGCVESGEDTTYQREAFAARFTIII